MANFKRMGNVAKGKAVKTNDEHVFKVEMGTWYFVPGVLEDDRRIIDLFRVCQYDIKNPKHWRLLLASYSKSYFGHKKKGRPTKWDKAAHSKLLLDLINLGSELRFNEKMEPFWAKKDFPSNRKAQAKLLKEFLNDDPLYRSSSVTEIYKNILEAWREWEREFWLRGDADKGSENGG